MKVALDSSVIVAAAQSWHERHGAARAAVSSLLADTDAEVVVPEHCFYEAFSVLTRLPKPKRVSPAVARALLADLLENRVTSFPLTVNPWELLERFAEEEIAGGAVYDALIAEAAMQAGARRVVTLNPRHFARFGAHGLEVTEPR